jgi:hypothetical protein
VDLDDDDEPLSISELSTRPEPSALSTIAVQDPTASAELRSSARNYDEAGAGVSAEKRAAVSQRSAVP